MKISLISPNLSSNGLGRAHLLAKILQRRYEVEIVGPDFGDGIWKPVADDKSIDYKAVKSTGWLNPYSAIPDLLRSITGDVIYVSKPMLMSYDVGLLKKCLSKKPLVLDIDDWELASSLYGRDISRSLRGFQRVLSYLRSTKDFFFHFGDSYYWTAFNERMARFADRITISNSFLKERFGGTIIWHARDTTDLDPAKFNKDSLRKEYGIGRNERTVMFCGTPRPHKGVEDLIAAMKHVPESLLIIAGMNEEAYCRKLVHIAESELGSKRIRAFAATYSQTAKFHAVSDVVVIPQRKNPVTIGQMPAKVFDAMAMAKPIVATKISDLPTILEGCGWLVEPDCPKALAQAIEYIFYHPEEAEEKGQIARNRCRDNYSYDAMESVLCNLFEPYE